MISAGKRKPRYGLDVVLIPATLPHTPTVANLTVPKNALFAGSDRGGEHWAIIASLGETCKLCGVDPQAYLADVLSRIVTGHLNTRIDDLLPWAYATTPDLSAVT